MAEAYIVAAARTAGGRRGGRLSGWHPADLAGLILDALVDRAGIDPGLVEDVIMGCVSQAGEQSTNIARNAVLASRLPESVPGTSVDRQCGSSQQAIHFAAQAVMSGSMDVVIAAGVESMTRVPMFMPSTLPLKNDLGYYLSPAMRRRYPHIQDFSQFSGAEMVAKNIGFPGRRWTDFPTSAINAPSRPPRRDGSRMKSCQSKFAWQTVRPPASRMPSMKASVMT